MRSDGTDAWWQNFVMYCVADYDPTAGDVLSNKLRDYGGKFMGAGVISFRKKTDATAFRLRFG